MTIKSIHDNDFRNFGNVQDSQHYQDIYHKLKTIPFTKNVVYVGSDELLESSSAKAYIEESVFGTIPIQIGYCNGENTKLNALEYHKSNEVIVAATDLLLILGQTFDIIDNTYDTSLAKVFKMKAGEVVEIYSTTLHYCPLSVNDKEFSAAILLPKHTNDVLLKPEEGLFARNKWLLGHAELFDLDSKDLIGKLIGENIEIVGGKYV